jgi:hypothetical protein
MPTKVLMLPFIFVYTLYLFCNLVVQLQPRRHYKEPEQPPRRRERLPFWPPILIRKAKHLCFLLLDSF